MAKGGLAKMPTLQAVDLNNFESVADTSAQLSQSGEFAHTANELHGTQLKSPLRGYLALGALFAIAGLGYAGLLLMLGHLVALAKG